MQLVTDLVPILRLEPSKIRVRGIAFAEWVRIWLLAQNWKLGENVEHVVPKLLIDYDFSVAGIDRRTVQEIECLFPEGIPWSDLPRIAVDSKASIDGVSDLGVDGYCEMLAAIALARAARLEVRRLRSGFVRFRLKVKGRTKPFDLLLPGHLLDPFLAPPTEV